MEALIDILEAKKSVPRRETSRKELRKYTSDVLDNITYSGSNLEETEFYLLQERFPYL